MPSSSKMLVLFPLAGGAVEGAALALQSPDRLAALGRTGLSGFFVDPACRLIITADEDCERSAFDRHRVPYWFTGLPLLHVAKVLAVGHPGSCKHLPVAL